MTTNYLDISHQSIVSYVDFIALGTFIKWRVNGKLWLPSFFVEHSFDKHGMYCESKILCQTILFLYDSLDHTNSFTHLHKWSQWPPFPLLQVSCFKWNNEAWKSETWTLQRSSDPNTFISFTVMRTWQKVVASWNVAFFRIEYIYIYTHVTQSAWFLSLLIDCWLSLSDISSSWGQVHFLPAGCSEPGQWWFQGNGPPGRLLHFVQDSTRFDHFLLTDSDKAPNYLHSLSICRATN